MAATCSKCGASIVWLKTPKGKWMPANEGLHRYKKSDEGKQFVVNDRGELIRCEIIEEQTRPGAPLTGMGRIPHWATCPYADSFRKRT